nr:hypothetical protein [Tanacetum cinerariifolium]
MTFTSLSSSTFDNEVASCFKAYTKAYATLQSHYDKLINDLRKSQFDVISYKTGLESVEARILVYQQTETIFEEDIKLLKHNVKLRDNALVDIRKKFEKAEQKRDDLKPTTPIIEDRVSDSEDEYEGEPMTAQKAPSFVQTTDHVKTPRPSDKTSLTHLIKDCDYYEKKMVQTPARNHAQRGNHQHYARMTHLNPQRHVVPIAVLTRSKLVPLTTVRLVTTDVPHNNVIRLRPAKTVGTKLHSPPRRNIIHRPSPPASNFPQKVTIVKAPKIQVSYGLGPKETLTFLFLVQGNLQHTLKDKGVIDNRCSRHMTGNMSYLSDFEEINGGFVAFGGNTKGWKDYRVLVTKPHNKTPYELLLGRTPSIGFMRPFGCPVTILNTLDPLGNFNGKADEGFLVGYSNTDGDATFEVKEDGFEVEEPESEVYVSPSSSAMTKKDGDKTKREAKGKTLEDITYSDDDADVGAEADFTNLETTITISPILTTRVHKDHLVTQIIGDLFLDTQTRSMTRMVKDQSGLTQINNEDFHTCMFACFLSQEEPKRVHQALKDPNWIDAIQEELLQFKMQKVWVLVDLPNEKKAIGFKDSDYPNNVYKVVKALYGLHQAPRAWYKTLANYLLENGFQKGKIDQALFIKKQKGDILLVQVYVDDIIFDGKSASTPIATEKPLLKDPDREDVDVHTYRLMIGSLMYLTSSRPVKRIFRYLKGKPHLGLWYPKDSPFNLVAYSDSDYAGASLDRKSTIGGCQFLGCRLIFWQCKKQTVVATSSTEAEYVAAASYCAQCMSAKRIAWNEFSSSMASSIIFLATVDHTCSSSHSTKYSSPDLTQKAADDTANIAANDVDDVVAEDVAKPTPPSPIPTTTPPPPQELPSTSQVSPTPPPSPIAPPSSPPQQPQPTTISMELLNTLLETFTTMTRRVENFEQDKIVQALEITKLKQRVRGCIQTRGIIADLDADKDVTLEEVDVEKNAEVEKNADVQGRLEESQAKDYHIDLEHADKVLSMQDDVPELAELKEVIEVVTTAKLMTKVVTTAATTAASTTTAAPSAAKRRKGVVIRDPEETATPSTIVHFEPKSKDKGKGILVEEPKPLKKQAQIEKDEAYTRELEVELNRNINWDDVIEQVKEKGKQDNDVLRYQALKRKPQTEAQSRKNMMVYLKNMDGIKMDYFKGMSYDAICLIFEKYFNSNVAFLEKSKEELEEEESRALKRQSKSSKEKAAKKQKLDEEVEELKKHLQIVPNDDDDDDVYTEATPLALKVPVVYYEIYTENNKPYYKIIRADGSH